MGKSKHSAALRALIAELGLTQEAAAARIRELSDDDIPTARTLRTWLASVGTKTKIKCPGWAVFILRTDLRRQK